MASMEAMKQVEFLQKLFGMVCVFVISFLKLISKLRGSFYGNHTIQTIPDSFYIDSTYFIISIEPIFIHSSECSSCLGEVVFGRIDNVSYGRIQNNI